MPTFLVTYTSRFEAATEEDAKEYARQLRLKLLDTHPIEAVMLLGPVWNETANRSV